MEVSKPKGCHAATVLQKTGVDSESAEKNAYCIEHEISGKTYEYSIGLLKKAGKR